MSSGVADSIDLSLDVLTLARRYAAGACSLPDVLTDVRRRVAAWDDPAVWVDLFPADVVDAQAEAVARRRAGGERLPLFGVPFAVKDNIDVAGRPTTAACPEFAYTAGQSATVVRRLCEAGAIVVGKTNLDQFATGLVGTRSPYGACRNVFDRRFISGGSSSGSAVAVAAGLVSFALGTDTAGSGRVPAGFGNIVGLKPTRGRLSTAGVVPACRSLDCVSVFALTCEDARLVADVAGGYDPQDVYSRRPGELARLAPALPSWPGAGGRFRFGVPGDEPLRFFGNEDGVGLFREAVERLRGLGGEAVTIDYAPFADAARLLYDGPWLAERLAAVGAFMAARPDAVLSVTRSVIQGGSKFTAVDAFKGQYELRRLARLAAAQWERMDVLAVPTAGRCYPMADVERDPVGPNATLGYYTNFVNLLDLCAVAVPSGFQPDGLPFGVTLIAPAGADGWALELAGAYHRATGLPLGATRCRQPDRSAPPPAPAAPGRVQLAVVGAHLSGQPLNHQLTDRGAVLVRACRTSPRYRLYALPGTTPPKPGLIRSAAGNGPAAGGGIEVEVWEMSAEAFGTFVAAIPPPLGVGTVELEDGTGVKCFLCEGYAVAGAQDISHFGGWRAYLRSLADSKSVNA